MSESRADAIRRRAEQWAEHGHDPDVVELVGLIRTAAEHVIAGSEAVLVADGLTRGQFDVLSALYRSGAALTQADLAGAMLITPAGMKKRIDALVAAGLIVRMPDPDDSRKALLSLSAAGEVRVEQLLAAFFAAEADALEPLSATGRGDLRRLLRDLVDGTPES